MPFTRRKIIKGIEYHYLVENYREDGKVRQRVLMYLGQHETVSAAHRYWTNQAKTAPDAPDRKRAREMVKKLAPYL